MGITNSKAKGGYVMNNNDDLNLENNTDSQDPMSLNTAKMLRKNKSYTVILEFFVKTLKINLGLN